MAWKAPHTSPPLFLFFCKPLLRVTQQPGREQYNQASYLCHLSPFISISGDFHSAWPFPGLVLVTCIQIWRSSAELSPCIPYALSRHLWFVTQETTLGTLDLQGSSLSPKTSFPFWKVFFLVKMLLLSSLPHISCGQHLDLVNRNACECLKA